MSQETIEIGPNNETVSVGDEFKVIGDVPSLLGGYMLDKGDTIEVVDIKTGLPNGSEIVIIGDGFKREKNVSPTTMGEALAVVEYKNNPEQSLERV